MNQTQIILIEGKIADHLGPITTIIYVTYNSTRMLQQQQQLTFGKCNRRNILVAFLS